MVETTSKVGFIRSKFPLYTKGRGMMQDCITTVLLSDDYGPILFDTGSPTNRESVVEGLKKDFGLLPEDIRFVFNTHIIHVDHMGTNELYTNAKTIFSGKELEEAREVMEFIETNSSDALLAEYMIKRYPSYAVNCGEREAKGFRKYMNFFWRENRLGHNIAFIEDEPDIPPFITVLPTPGHTPNHYSFIIEESDMSICIAGDAVAKRSILTKDPAKPESFGRNMEFENYLASLEKIKQHKGLLVPGHDEPFET